MTVAVGWQRVHFEKTGTAINRTTLRRIKGNGRVTIASGAINGDFDFLFDSGFVGGKNDVEPFIFRLFTILTAFRRIQQTFIPEEHLFANRPYKVFSTINAPDTRILKIRLDGKSRLIKFFEIVRQNLIFLILFDLEAILDSILFNETTEHSKHSVKQKSHFFAVLIGV